MKINLMSLKWPYLIVGLIFFCEIYAIIFSYIFHGNYLDTAFDKSPNIMGFSFSLIMVPIVLVSLKLFKSYLLMGVLSILAILLRAMLIVSLVNELNLTSMIGDNAIYLNGDITNKGWLYLIINPIFIGALFSFYKVFKRERD